MKFKIEALATFEAEDLDQALRILASHFLVLGQGKHDEDTCELDIEGEITVKAV